MSKHRGIKVTPSTVYHKSNPIFRKDIDRHGLMVMKGDSYGLYSPEDTEPHAIFGKTDDTYDSTYDDDIWLIDCDVIGNDWFIDKACGNGCVVTYEDIPRFAIKLIYEGTGNSE